MQITLSGATQMHPEDSAKRHFMLSGYGRCPLRREFSREETGLQRGLFNPIKRRNALKAADRVCVWVLLFVSLKSKSQHFIPVLFPNARFRAQKPGWFLYFFLYCHKVNYLL